MLKGVNKVIIDSQPGANGVVPYLPLPELQQRGARAAPARPQPPQLDGVQGAAQ